MQAIKTTILICVFLVSFHKFAKAIEIIQPTEGQLFETGSTVRVVVKPQNGESWVAVGIGFDSLPYDNSISAYVREFPLAKDTSLGEYEFKVEALSDSSQIVELTRKIVVVLPAAVKLKSLGVYPNPVFLSKLPQGSDPKRVVALETEEFSVIGIYSDASRREISSVSPVTTYISSNEGVVKVDTTGKLTAQGVGTANITVRSGGLEAVVKVYVEAKSQ
jgi:hypothetical protein